MICKDDKELLAKLFNPGDVCYSVYDGKHLQRTLICEQYAMPKSANHNLVFVDHGDCEDVLEDFDICIVSEPKKHPLYHSKRFAYIANPDGTMRWFFPADLKTPTFLSFYSATTLKAHLFVILCKLLFALHLQRFFVSGVFTVISNRELAFDRLSKQIACSGYSIFTGTVGKNRKGVVEFHQGKVVQAFFKMPFDTHSATIIDQERQVLLELEKRNPIAFKYPAIPFADTPIPGLLQENIAIEGATRASKIDDRHFKFLDALYEGTEDCCAPSQCAFMQDVEGYLKSIEEQDAIYLSVELLPKLKALYIHLQDKDKLSIAWAHADFVPWNIFATSERLHVYDWELSRQYYPALFDVFHFVFQSGILINKASLSDILRDLEDVYAMPGFKALVKKLDVDVETQLSAYLLLNVSHYLSIYMEQAHLHKQVYWLLNIWNQALDFILEASPMLHSKRHSLIRNFLCYLHEQEVEYAVLKIANKDLFQLNVSSDIDLLFKAEAVDPFLDNLIHFSYLKRMNVSRRSNLVTIEFFLDDGSFLSLDLVLAFKRREVVYLEADQILKRRILDHRGFYRLSYNDDIDYMLNFYILNGDLVPQHYRDYFLAMPTEVQQYLLDHVTQDYHYKANHLSEVFEQNEQLLVNMRQSVKSLPQNRGFKRLRNIFQYINDTQKMVRLSKGFTLTLSGVDGAGKTTLLESTQAYLEKTLRKQVVLLRLRPSVLPILSAYKYGKDEAEKRSMGRLPRTGTNSSVPKSIFRFMYYYLDYILGQWLVYFKHTIRGKVVIYDRYYFDFMNDPRRMNLELPQWITKIGYHLIFKPRLNLFLYAQPEVILARKEELDGDTIKQLNASYLDCFDHLGKRYKKSEYVCIENEELEDTEKIIRDYINAIA